MSLINKDDRRSLYEWRYPVTKVLKIHKDCIVGNHYHKLRKEMFILLKGIGEATIGDKVFEMTHFEEIPVDEGVMHSFCLSKGSILLEFATKDYDPTDDYKS
jgi:mannose-6-phosphate isomerase-like protein (cupin superfamily)